MNNGKIQQEGFKAVIAYEKKRGWEAKPYQKNGYDLVSKKMNSIRHIEVKATSKKQIYFRWLEENEFKALKSDKKYYLYLVTNALNSPTVFTFTKKQTLSRFKGEEIKYLFTFNKEDFKKHKYK